MCTQYRAVGTRRFLIDGDSSSMQQYQQQVTWRRRSEIVSNIARNPPDLTRRVHRLPPSTLFVIFLLYIYLLFVRNVAPIKVLRRWPPVVYVQQLIKQGQREQKSSRSNFGSKILREKRIFFFFTYVFCICAHLMSVTKPVAASSNFQTGSQITKNQLLFHKSQLPPFLSKLYVLKMRKGRALEGISNVFNIILLPQLLSFSDNIGCDILIC